MTSSNPATGVRRAFAAAAALATSGGAFAALLYLNGGEARASAELRPDRVVVAASHEADTAASSVGSAIVPSAAPAMPHVADATQASPTVAPLQEAPVAPERTVVVPDFTGKRVSLATREARALGLRLVARDSSGECVPGYDARYYRVSHQTIEPGVAIEPGEVISVRARYASYGQGY